MNDFGWCKLNTLKFNDSRYNDDMSLLCGQLSSIAYSSHYDIRYYLKPLGVSSVDYHKTKEGGEVWLMRFNVFAAIVFIGTNESLDWKSNFNIRMINIDNRFSVHAGFYKAMQDLLEPIKRFIASIPSEIPRIVTGHSAGAGLAQILFAITPESFDQCYVYAPSRPGDSKLAAILDNHGSNKIANVNDLVTWSPWFGLETAKRFRNYRLRTFRHGRIHQLCSHPYPDITHYMSESTAVLTHVFKALSLTVLFELFSSHSSRYSYVPDLKKIRTRNLSRKRLRRRNE